MKTKTGFEWEIVAENYGDDLNFLKLLRAYSENATYMLDVATYLLGPEQMKRLEEHCTIDGRVSTKLFQQELHEIIEADKDLKK